MTPAAAPPPGDRRAADLLEAAAPGRAHTTSRLSARSERRLAEGSLLVTAVALEALPVYAWLALLAAANGRNAAPALPMWWLAAMILAAALVATACGAAIQRSAHEWLTRTACAIGALLGWATSLIVALAFSPAGYAGATPGSVIHGLADDIALGSQHVNSDIALALLVGYLWWRGFLLVRDPLYRERVNARFLMGLGAIVLAIAGAAAISGAARLTIEATLTLVLPTEVFVGLVGIALAHVADTAREHRARLPLALDDEPAAASINRSWLTSALGLSALVVTLAVLLTLIVSYGSLRALANLLAPVVGAMLQVLDWIIEGLALALFSVFFIVINFVFGLLGHGRSTQTSVSIPHSPGQRQYAPGQPPAELLAIGRGVVAVALAVMIFAVLLWVLRRFAPGHADQGFEEERQALDARSLLRQQLRDFFTRRSTSSSVSEEPLPIDSVRYLYRDMLRAATGAGLPRRANETADEFAQRLRATLASRPPAGEATSATPTEVASAVAELTAAYDPARYDLPAPHALLDQSGAAPGDNSVAAASSSVQAAWRLIMAWLAGLRTSQPRPPRSRKARRQR